MASSSNDKICIQCGESLKENDLLNHVGAQYQDNQNERHPLQTISEQAQPIKLDNLASNIEENLQNKTPTLFILQENDLLNHVGAQYQDNQNERHPLQTISEQAQPIKLDNLASNIEENLQNKTPTLFILHLGTT